MRLLLYIHSLENGGAERVAATLANYWASIGWDVTVVTVAPRSTDFYALDTAVKRVTLDLAERTPHLFAGVLRTVRRVQALRRILRDIRPDVALSVMQTANVVLALAARGIAGLRTIGSEHNYPPKAPLGVLWETMRRYSYGYLGAVVALTQECASWLAVHSHARHIPVIPNAVGWPLSPSEPALSPASWCRPGRQLLLGVGRLSPEKNFGAMIEVFARLADRHPAWDLVILGDGPARADLQSRIDALGLAQRICLPGRAGNVGDWYERATLYAMSSQFEGFPNTLVEAMAYGLPAVSFDCDTGPRDIIRHGVDGLLVPPDDLEGMQRALDQLMTDSAMRGRFATRAREARERFSLKKVSRMWEALFAPPGAA